ncbi:MAG: hypothetical protein V3V08_04105 [Nannocystaceae bacterium]
MIVNSTSEEIYDIQVRLRAPARVKLSRTTFSPSGICHPANNSSTCVPGQFALWTIDSLAPDEQIVLSALPSGVAAFTAGELELFEAHVYAGGELAGVSAAIVRVGE